MARSRLRKRVDKTLSAATPFERRSAYAPGSTLTLTTLSTAEARCLALAAQGFGSFLTQCAAHAETDKRVDIEAATSQRERALRREGWL